MDSLSKAESLQKKLLEAFPALTKTLLELRAGGASPKAEERGSAALRPPVHHGPNKP